MCAAFRGGWGEAGAPERILAKLWALHTTATWGRPVCPATFSNINILINSRPIVLFFSFSYFLASANHLLCSESDFD